jgi:DNA-binding response OmpR family regulator
MTTEEAAELARDPAGHLTILVVEDDQFVRDLVDEILTEAGYRVVTAVDADGAEEVAVREVTVDAVIVDSSVPGGGGARLAERLRVRHPRAAVLLVSGGTEQERTTGHAALRFLGKPFSGAQLLAALNELLADRRGPD